MEFCDINIAEELSWQAIVFLPKILRDFCAIGMVEVLWKAIYIVLGSFLGKAIEFHDVLHVFQDKRGTGTASI